MFKRYANIVLLSALALLSGAASASVTYDLTDSNNCFPIGCGPMHYEQIYSASQFTTGAVAISSIGFRPDAMYGHAFGPTAVDLDIGLAATTVDPSAISADFAQNQAASLVQVFSGTAMISSDGSGSYDILFPFTSNFLYDPAKGNLLLDLNVKNSQNVSPLAAGYSPLVGRATVNYGFAEGGYGLATRFETAAADVPEPATLSLFAFGLAGCIAVRRKVAKK